jgi:hypothetical protein
MNNTNVDFADWMEEIESLAALEGLDATLISEDEYMSFFSRGKHTDYVLDLLREREESLLRDEQ